MKLLPPPGPERRRQLFILAIVTPVLAYALWTNFGPATATPPPPPAPRQAPQASAPQGPGTRGTAGTSAGASPSNGLASLLPEEVRLAALVPVVENPQVGRNPFAFGMRPPPPAPPPPPPSPPVEYKPPPPAPPPIPSIPFSYHGMLGDMQGRPIIALFKDKSGVPRLIHNKGELIDGQYKVIDYSPTSATVSFADGSHPRVLMRGGGGGGL